MPGKATAERQAGDYTAPVSAKPAKRPIPAWTGGPELTAAERKRLRRKRARQKRSAT